jgi:pimeloyl-ACP methyl ester carboxylesterase
MRPRAGVDAPPSVRILIQLINLDPRRRDRILTAARPLQELPMTVSDIRPYRLVMPDQAIVDLQERLQRTRWPDDYVDQNWEFGTDQTYLKSLCAYWADGYDWRAREAKLNAWPHFTTVIDGQEIHFIHLKSAAPNAQPLLITHGWPGSFVEMLKIIPMLTEPQRFGGDANEAFDVVVPSLPGFGLSGRPARAGTNPQVIAGLFAKLMQRLGYDRFGAQGGDFGASITVWLARDHADRLTGFHLNMMPGSLRPAPGTLAATPATDAEKKLMADAADFLEREGGYSHIQRTKPQTLGVGLNDSPAGLASWIIEKFRGWSDCDGNVESVLSRDELLDNISLYWLTQTITSSVRLYRESARVPLQIRTGERITPPMGFARFPKELVQPPREWLERFFNLVHWTEMPRGGHFAAMEQPELLAADLRKFFGPLRG